VGRWATGRSLLANRKLKPARSVYSVRRPADAWLIDRDLLHAALPICALMPIAQVFVAALRESDRMNRAPIQLGPFAKSRGQPLEARRHDAHHVARAVGSSTRSPIPCEWTGVGSEPNRHGSNGVVMKRRSVGFFTVYTARGSGSYRSSSRARAAARWVAHETGETVTVVDEATGQRSEVSVGGGSPALLPR
jgi:hypothetical protein